MSIERKECATQHYDGKYHLRRTDIDSSWITVDPYFVAAVWQLGERDPSGCLFHILKTVARLGKKEGNSIERELQSIEATLKRFREVVKVNRFDIDEEEYNT